MIPSLKNFDIIPQFLPIIRNWKYWFWSILKTNLLKLLKQWCYILWMGPTIILIFMMRYIMIDFQYPFYSFRPQCAFPHILKFLVPQNPTVPTRNFWRVDDSGSKSSTRKKFRVGTPLIGGFGWFKISKFTKNTLRSKGLKWLRISYHFSKNFKQKNMKLGFRVVDHEYMIWRSTNYIS